MVIPLFTNPSWSTNILQFILNLKVPLYSKGYYVLETFSKFDFTIAANTDNDYFLNIPSLLLFSYLIEL